MSRKVAALAVAFAGVALAACAGRYGEDAAASGATYALPGMPDLTITATLPKRRHAPRTIGNELPAEGLGRIKDPHWKAMLGGYTQEKFSQALAFPPGTEITIKNISQTYSHTLNVVAKVDGPPAKFPARPEIRHQAVGGQAAQRLRQRGDRTGFLSDGHDGKARNLPHRLRVPLLRGNEGRARRFGWRHSGTTSHSASQTVSL